jgi:deoxyribonuclease (pyrimidine dimer)
MVRINLIDPKYLADQHLLAEHDEILMLVGHVRKYPYMDEVVLGFRLGKGHIKFFKDKLLYIKKRDERIKKEMRRRGYRPKVSVDLAGFDKVLLKDWRPGKRDKRIITRRIMEKIRKKPRYYTYYKVHKPPRFFLDMMRIH